MKVKLVFQDWQTTDGTSIYTTDEGVAMAAGNLHSGSTFDAEVVFDDDDVIDLYIAKDAGLMAVFSVLPDEGRQATGKPAAS